MTTIVTRASKGSPLSNSELDANFENLNNDKLELIVTSITSGATITPPSGNSQYNITALAVDATFAEPSGTPEAGLKLILRLKDNGTARNLSWNSIYRAVNCTLPTQTTAGKLTYIGLVYNSTDSKWDAIAVVTEV